MTELHRRDPAADLARRDVARPRDDRVGAGPIRDPVRNSNEPLGAWVTRVPLARTLPSRLIFTFQVWPTVVGVDLELDLEPAVLGRQLELPVGRAAAAARLDDVAVLGTDRAGGRRGAPPRRAGRTMRMSARRRGSCSMTVASFGARDSRAGTGPASPTEAHRRRKVSPDRTQCSLALRPGIRQKPVGARSRLRTDSSGPPVGRPGSCEDNASDRSLGRMGG